MAVKRTTLPRWATDDVINGTSGLNNVIEPSEAKKNLGWDYLEKPARQYFNWMGRQTNQWLDYLDESTNVFAPHENDPQTMTVQLNAGRLNQGTTVVIVAAQTTGVITSPITNPRIDRIVIDKVTGLASIVAGVENAAPVPPSFDVEDLPVCDVLLTVGMTEITNADITDIRSQAPFSGVLVDNQFFRRPDSTGIGTYYQNDTTGDTLTNGFFVGINDSEQGLLWNYGSTGLTFGNNNQIAALADNNNRWLFTDTGSILFPLNEVMTIYNSGGVNANLVTRNSLGQMVIGVDSTGESNISTTNDINFLAGFSFRGKVDNGGNWLISPIGGNITPAYELVVYDSGAGSTSYIQFINDGTGTTSGDGFLIGVDANENAVLSNLEATEMRFALGGTLRAKFETTGNFLITPDGGDVTPLHHLVVYGSGAGSNSYAQFVSDSTGQGVSSGFIVGINAIEQAELWNFHGSDMRFGTSNIFRGKIDNGGKWLISPNGSDIEPAHELVIYNSLAGNDSFIQFINDSTGVTSADGFIVGIDTAENAVLHNYENTDIQFSTNNTLRGKIDNGGNWLITPDGTDLQPNHELVLYKNSASSDCHIQFANLGTLSTATDGFIVGINSLEEARLWNQENTDMIFATNNLERMRIEADGSVEIGTGLINKGVGTLNVLNGAYLNNRKILQQNYTLGSGRFMHSHNYVTTPNGMQFKTDGLKIFVLDESTDRVFQYNLSTAWDVTTRDAGSNISVSGQDVAGTGLFFKPDGTRMFMMGSANDRVYQYNLSTAWDVTTAVYSGVSVYVGAGSVGPTGLTFSSNGSYFYILGSSTDVLIRYTCPTAWDLTGVTGTIQSISTTAYSTIMANVYMHPNGLIMYAVSSTGVVFLLHLTTANSLTSLIQDDGENFVAVNAGFDINAITFSEDGDYFYTANNASNKIDQYASNTLVVDVN